MASTVTNLVWAPVAGYFSDSALVFVAPDAQLYTVSFAGLPNKQGYLIESHPVHYLRAGRDLLPNLVSANTGLVAVGDPDFSSDPKQSRLASTYDSDEWDKSDPLRGALDNCSSLRLRNLARLPGSRSEVEEVAKLWAQFSGETSHLLIGEDASEDNFRRPYADQYQSLGIEQPID